MSMASTKMVPSCQPGSISRGEPASPSSLTCGCTLGAKKKLTISLNLSSKDCDVAAFLFLNHQQFIFKSLASSIINLRTPGYFYCISTNFTFPENQALEKGERTHSYILFIFVYRWQLCDMFVNSCWCVLAWFSVQHMPSLHNAACCVSNFGVLESQQKYNSYNSFILI